MQRKKWILCLLSHALFILIPGTLTQAQASTSVANPLFGYTHLLPSPFTLPPGKFVIGGTSAGIGITDFMAIETDLIADFYQIYNARVKLSLLDFPGLAAGLYLGLQSVNLSVFSSSNPSITVNSWMPGGVIGLEIFPLVALYFGGNLFYSNVETGGNGIVTAGFLKGGQLEADLSWAYNPKPDDDRIGNVLSAGISYNTTYNIFGFGLSHHWGGFQLGIHYYPNADQLKVLPILSGGATFDI